MVQRKNIVFILGTAYCGSTILGCTLNAIEGISYMGEIDRLKVFKQYEDTPSHYRSKCVICVSHHEYNCPIFSEEFIEKLNQQSGVLEAYLQIVDRYRDNFLIDGSKFPRWLHMLLEKGLQNFVNVYAIIAVRNPFSTAASYARAEVNPQPPWRAGEIWRDTYVHALRLCSSYMVPAIVIRNETFRNSASKCLNRILSMIRVSGDPTRACRDFFNHELHCIGGNLGTYIHYPNFNTDIAIERDPKWRERISDKVGRNPILSNQDETLFKISRTDGAAVMNVPGLVDIAAHLGYAPFYDVEFNININRE